MKEEIIRGAIAKIRNEHQLDIDEYFKKNNLPISEMDLFLTRLSEYKKYHLDISPLTNKRYIKRTQETWQEKFWWVVAIVTYIAGAFTPLIQKSIEQKISPKSTQSKPAIPILSDTSSIHKMN